MKPSGRLAQLAELARLLVRRKTPLVFGDPARTGPVSRRFGFDRGMPIDRYYIEQFLGSHAAGISGTCLEVGELNYLRRFGSPREAVALVPHSPEAPAGARSAGLWAGDLTRPETLPAERFDCFVCTQTLPFIYDFAAAIRGAHALLAPGGLFLGTSGGVSQVSRHDMDRWGDYWRFSSLALTRALREVFAEVSVTAFGNALSAQLALQGVAVEDLPDPAVLDDRDPEFEVILGFAARKVKAGG